MTGGKEDIEGCGGESRYLKNEWPLSIWSCFRLCDNYASGLSKEKMCGIRICETLLSNHIA